MKDKILKLRTKGKTYNEIQKKLGCSKGTISYHCGDGVKEKTKKRNKKNREADPDAILKGKVAHFISLRKKKTEFLRRKKTKGGRIKGETPKTFTLKDVIKKIGENPRCYLTGDKIDLSIPKAFSFDHIIPVYRGGENSLNNLGLCTVRANEAKHKLFLDEFILLCRKVCENFGYKVVKIN